MSSPRSSSFSPPHTPTLPSKFIVPPTPPRIHRSLIVRKLNDGLLIHPRDSHDDDMGIIVGWGIKPTIRKNFAPALLKEGRATLEVAGVIGILRLWETSYLLVFVAAGDPIQMFPPPSDKKEFPNELPQAPPDEDPLMRSLRAIAEREGIFSSPTSKKELQPRSEREAWELRNVAAIPLNAAGAEAAIRPTETSAGETPAQAFARVLNPQKWKFGRTQSSDDLEAKVPMLGQEVEAIKSDRPPQRKDLEAKIVRETVRELGAGGFFYSYETDLSHNLQHKRKQLAARSQSSGLLTSLLHSDDITSSPLEPPAEISSSPPTSCAWIEPDVGLPLWRRVDPRFMWNAHLAKDLIDQGLHAYVLPIVQGWVQATRFYVPSPKTDAPLDPPSTPVDLVLISRRSKERAGLRFQRRGIDEDGHVANFVETELMVRVLCEDRWNIFSFTQVRGSIPLFWSQSSTLTSMKPAPVLDRPVDQTLGITRLHFDDLKKRYGPQTVVNLAEITGKESVVTLGFKEAVEQLEDADVRYQAFDFHNECKGMKYGNISKLVDALSDVFSEQGYFWTNGPDVMREQRGTFRVNCIDCLDRTNVVESALARHVLANQLTQVGLVQQIDESQFNDAWANNGDQISRVYAGTSALKGDFTRTGKRDLSGMMHDGVNSLTRMFSGAVSDYFTQAVISYMVGQRSIAVFSEFLANLQASDGISLVRLSRIRAAAIEVCSARVIEEGELRVAGWTLFSPEEANVRLTAKLEEKVVLLTKAAVYVVSFDYNLEKVVASTRIPLRNIHKIVKGAYILSAIQEAGRDPEENAGFQLFFQPSEAGTRMTSYAALNASPLPEAKRTRASDSDGLDFFAFKALPREFVVSGEDDDDIGRGKDETCREVVDRLVARIREECVRAAGSIGGYVGGHARGDDFVVNADVVSLAEAQKVTSLMSRADYAIKRMLWLP